MKNKRGITLIALVITIIILLLLAGITISQLGGEDGLLPKIKFAKEKQFKAEAKENVNMAIMQIQMDDAKESKNTTLQNLKDNLPIKDERILIEDYDEQLNILKGIYDNGENQYNFLIYDDFSVTIENEINNDEGKREIYLYRSGDVCNNVTSGWEYLNGCYSGSYAKLNDEGYIEFHAGGNIATTLKNVDFLKYKYLNVEIEGTSYNGNRYTYFSVTLYDKLGSFQTSDFSYGTYTKNILVCEANDFSIFERKCISIPLEEISSQTTAISMHSGFGRDFKVYSVSLSNLQK